MFKKLLLTLGAAAVAMGASAATYQPGEAFAYKIDQNFVWDAKGHDEVYQNGNSQYPADLLRGQASMAEGFGFAACWFAQNKYITTDAAEPTEENSDYMTVAADPWNEGQYAIRMYSVRWDAFGNFNFALPEVGEPCRVRIIYRIDDSVANTYAEGEGKTLKVKLMDDADQDTPDYPQVEEFNYDLWAKAGWHTVDFISDLAGDNYYLSLLFDGGGLSCSKKVPFYVKEVSVVPVRLLEGYTAPADNKGLTVTAEMPELVTIAANEVEPDTFVYAMPGTYQGWSLENNLFTKQANGTYTQDIARLTGDFKILQYVPGQPKWDIQWGSNGTNLEVGTPYAAAFNGGNLIIGNDNPILHNATVTLTPGADNAMSIMVTAENIEVQGTVWQLVGQTTGWNFTDAPQFAKKDDSTYELAYTGTIAGEFKVVKNAAWGNAYSTKNAVELNKTYELEGPGDLSNMWVATTDGGWIDPVFTLTVGEKVTLKVTGTAGVANVSVDAAAAEYFNLQGVRVANPSNGVFIVRQGSKVSKVTL